MGRVHHGTMRVGRHGKYRVILMLGLAVLLLASRRRSPVPG